MKYHPYKYLENELSISDAELVERFYFGGPNKRGFCENHKETPKDFLRTIGLECRRKSDYAFWIATRNGEYYSTLVVEDEKLWQESRIKYKI